MQRNLQIFFYLSIRIVNRYKMQNGQQNSRAVFRLDRFPQSVLYDNTSCQQCSHNKSFVITCINEILTYSMVDSSYLFTISE